LGSLFQGSPRQIEESLFGGLFHQWDTKRTISVTLTGTGPEARSVMIARELGEVTIPFNSDDTNYRSYAPITFSWNDAEGRPHVGRPQISPQGIKMPGTDEDTPDFFFFAASHAPSSDETAGHFSLLSRSGRSEAFTKIFGDEYNWIENLTIEVLAGAPSLHVGVKGSKAKIPINDVSSGINKLMGIAGAIASRDHSVVLVDEIENGIYYRHMESMWRMLIRFARDNDSQIFASTHSRECIKALFNAGAGELSDIQLIRIERDDGGPAIRQFSGDDIEASLEYEEEVR
jgi:hypothetical protein